MKFLYLLLVLFVLSFGVSGQTPANPSDTSAIEVVQMKWHIQVRIPALDEDPFRAVDDNNRAARERRENIRTNEILNSQGKPSELPPVSQRPMDAAPRDPWTSYMYEVKFKNNGGKEIQTITWDYVFCEPETKQELGRRQFISKVSIDPGKTKTWITRSGFPPTDTIDAARADKKKRAEFFEQIVIQASSILTGLYGKLR